MSRNLEFPHKFGKVSLFEDGKEKATSIHLFVRSYYRWYIVAANIARQESLQENIQKRCFRIWLRGLFHVPVAWDGKPGSRKPTRVDDWP